MSALREELGDDEYGRYERAIVKYCVVPEADANAVLCPNRALRDRWRLTHLMPYIVRGKADAQ